MDFLLPYVGTYIVVMMYTLMSWSSGMDFDARNEIVENHFCEFQQQGRTTTATNEASFRRPRKHPTLRPPAMGRRF